MVCRSLLIPCTFWQCSSLFTPPTSICSTPHPLHSQKILHCEDSFSYSFCISVGSSPSPSLNCSSPGLCYILYSSSSKRCSSQSSHSEVRGQTGRFAHAYNRDTHFLHLKFSILISSWGFPPLCVLLRSHTLHTDKQKQLIIIIITSGVFENHTLVHSATNIARWDDIKHRLHQQMALSRHTTLTSLCVLHLLELDQSRVPLIVEDLNTDHISIHTCTGRAKYTNLN